MYFGSYRGEDVVLVNPTLQMSDQHILQGTTRDGARW